MTEREYRNLDIDSYSSLKDFSIDRRKYYSKYILKEKVEEEESVSSLMGRIVETLLMEPEEFDNRFHIFSLVKAPSGKMLDFIKALCKYRIENSELSFEEIAKLAYKESGFEWNFDLVLKKFANTDNEIYYRELLDVKSRNLSIVTSEQVEKAEKIVNTIRTNQFTSWIFFSDNIEYQVKIEGFSYKGFPLKAMVDFVIIDEKNKVVRPFDLKCVWSVENFYKEYYLYRRSYIQAFVTKLACQYKYPSYRVENLSFLVSDSSDYYDPIIYTLNQDDMDDAINGFSVDGKKYPGVDKIVEDLKWCLENNIWRISRTNYEKSATLNIKNEP